MARIPRVVRQVAPVQFQQVQQRSNAFASAIAPAIGALGQYANEENDKIQARANQKLDVDFLKAASAYEAGLSEMQVPEGGDGYVLKAKEVFDNTFGGLKDGVPAHMQDVVKNRIDRTAIQLGDAALRAQNGEAEAFSKFQLGEGLDAITSEAARNPAAADALRAKATEMIANNPDLSASERRTLQDKVSDDILESAETGRVRSDPLAAKTYAGAVSTADLIKNFEGYSDKAYWDVNAQRAGYGSDTTTLEDGTVVKITKDTVVTRADSERDLQRRIAEFQKQAVSDIGAEAWAKLPQNVQSALTSITYNYGEVPKRIREAARSGDTYALADAVEGLSGDNDGINAKRRQREADVIRGGSTGLSAASYGRVQSAASQIVKAETAAANLARAEIGADMSVQVSRGETTYEELDAARADDQITPAKWAELTKGLDSFHEKETRAREQLDLISQVLANEGALNPYDPDQRKGVEQMDQQLQDRVDPADLPEARVKVATETGVASASHIADLRNRIGQGDAAAYDEAKRIISRSPLAFDVPNGSDIKKAVGEYDTYTRVGMSPEAAAKAVSSSPEERATRADIAPEIKKELKSVGSDDVIDALDSWLPFDEPNLSSHARMSLDRDFRTVYTVAREGGMPPEAAKQHAVKTLIQGGLYGVSTYASGGFKKAVRNRSAKLKTDRGVMRLPPENFYPPINGGHDYIGKDIRDSLASLEGYEDGEWFLMPDERETEEYARKIANGQTTEMPGYVLAYEDQDGIIQTTYWRMEAGELQAQKDKATAAAKASVARGQAELSAVRETQAQNRAARRDSRARRNAIIPFQ